MDADVLVAGAGPVGLTAAIELRRRGVDVLIVEPRLTVAPWAKAVGVQPRTLEIRAAPDPGDLGQRRRLLTEVAAATGRPARRISAEIRTGRSAAPLGRS